MDTIWYNYHKSRTSAICAQDFTKRLTDPAPPPAAPSLHQECYGVALPLATSWAPWLNLGETRLPHAPPCLPLKAKIDLQWKEFLKTLTSAGGLLFFEMQFIFHAVPLHGRHSSQGPCRAAALKLVEGLLLICYVGSASLGHGLMARGKHPEWLDWDRGKYGKIMFLTCE
jgi:hypothetical protein